MVIGQQMKEERYDQTESANRICKWGGGDFITTNTTMKFSHYRRVFIPVRKYSFTSSEALLNLKYELYV